MVEKKLTIGEGGFTPPGLQRTFRPLPAIDPPFDPAGNGFDIQRALLAGMFPNKAGRFGSVAPVSTEEQKLFGVPKGSFLVLKGRKHPTFDKTVAAEKKRGFKIVKRGGRLLSIQEAKRR